MDKAEEYYKAQGEFQEAMKYKADALGSDALARKAPYYQMATYHILEAIYHQNNVVIELLKKQNKEKTRVFIPKERKKTMNNKILPCPICGRKPKTDNGTRFAHGYRIHCEGKGHTIVVFRTPTDRIFKNIWKRMNHDIWQDNCSNKVMRVVRKQAILEWNQRKI